MSFTSLAFYLFLPLVFGGYWLICHPSDKGETCQWRLWLQNFFVVVASYVFYGWWDWRFLVLITITALWAWASGVLMEGTAGGNGRRAIVAVALVVNLGILGVFKYFNFFAESAASLLSMIGFTVHPTSLKIILPVGISFYTFQALSYVIDVYRKDISPTKDVVAFMAFVSFFPQLVAGPIERATNLLPQFLKARSFDYALAVDGCRQMLWGFFKKCLVADSCALGANMILKNPDAPSVSLWVGMACFAFQIYGDFSGYSDIAIGCSKLFGIRLMDNFRTPYFSRDIAEFWRRWHISLTTWFRDYLYIPLGGSRCSLPKKIRNTFVIFLVSGLWHGANWTFVAWGAFHACCFLPLLVRGKNRVYVANTVAEGRALPSFAELRQILFTFFLAAVGWTFFRAPDISTAFRWLVSMFSFSNLAIRNVGLGHAKSAIIPLVVLLVLEWLNRDRCNIVLPRIKALRWSIYVIVLLSLLFLHAKSQTFIYFQF